MLQQCAYIVCTCVFSFCYSIWSHWFLCLLHASFVDICFDVSARFSSFLSFCTLEFEIFRYFSCWYMVWFGSVAKVFSLGMAWCAVLHVRCAHAGATHICAKNELVCLFYTLFLALTLCVSCHVPLCVMPKIEKSCFPQTYRHFCINKRDWITTLWCFLNDEALVPVCCCYIPIVVVCSLIHFVECFVSSPLLHVDPSSTHTDITFLSTLNKYRFWNSVFFCAHSLSVPNTRGQK